MRGYIITVLFVISVVVEWIALESPIFWYNVFGYLLAAGWILYLVGTIAGRYSRDKK